MVGFVKGKKPDFSGLARNKGRPPAAIGGKGGGVTKKPVGSTMEQKPVGTGKPLGGRLFGGTPNISGSKGSVAPMPSRGTSTRRPNPRVEQKPVGKPNMPMVPSKLPQHAGLGLGNKERYKPTLKGIGSLGKIASKTMMKKGGAIKKAKPRSKK